MATTMTVAMPTDNLNPPPAPSRVYYSLGRMLGVDDFQADQDYHRGCLARALLQLCGTGTVAGLNVSIPQVWQPNTSYPASAFVYDSSQNVQVNTGVAGTSGSAQPAFATAPGGTVTDGTGIVWTNQGPVNANGWRPNAPFTSPSAIVDSNNNIQILNGNATFTAGPLLPVWSTAIGSTTLDGSPAVLRMDLRGPIATGDRGDARAGRRPRRPHDRSAAHRLHSHPAMARQSAARLPEQLFQRRHRQHPGRCLRDLRSLHTGSDSMLCYAGRLLRDRRILRQPDAGLLRHATRSAQRLQPRSFPKIRGMLPGRFQRARLRPRSLRA